MTKTKKGEQATKLRKLRSTRLVLIVLAVVLVAAILAVRLLWIPSLGVPAEPSRDANSSSSQQGTPQQEQNQDSEENGSGWTLPGQDKKDQEDTNTPTDPVRAGNDGNNEQDAAEKPSQPAPTESQPAPTESQPAPTESRPTPTESQPAPTESQPAPTESQPAPTESQPAPTESKPTPTESQPAPTESKPAPTESKPAPTESKPAPTESQPAPTESKPAPTESQPASPQSQQPEPEHNPQVLPNEDSLAINNASSAYQGPQRISQTTTMPQGDTQAAVDQNVTTTQNASDIDTAYIVFYVLCGLLGVDLVAIVILTVLISKEKKKSASRLPEEKSVRTEIHAAPAPAVEAADTKVKVGQLHNIGARPYQEDSSGVSMLDDGILAVVADGMGGLSGGDKVSQKIVYTMLSYGDQLRPGYIDGALERMVYGTNEAVNKMLGPEGLYKSGSTLLAVLARNNRFHWITVGDSHIYYFHNGRLVQLNEEHTRGTELLHKAERGEISFEEARNDPKRNGLTSFIGMGKLKYIDKSNESIPLVSGDRIVLMTDGVFNALSDQTIEAVLARNPDVQAAADEMERLVIQRANPRQDNFTAVILGF